MRMNEEEIERAGKVLGTLAVIMAMKNEMNRLRQDRAEHWRRYYLQVDKGNDVCEECGRPHIY